MSRDDPLAPLLNEIESEALSRNRKYMRARTGAGWFMTILMLGWVSKYAFGVL